MTNANEVAYGLGMSDDHDTEGTPAGRLRAVREEKGMSRNRLAQLVGRAESTVRAHENGQNALSAEMAAKYSTVLGVSGSYLLFGSGHAPVPESTSGLRVIPVLNKVARDVWYDRLRDFTADDLVVPVRSFPDLSLTAFWVSDNSVPLVSRGGYVITVDELAYSWQLGDWIVAEISGGGRVELAARQLDFDPERQGGASLRGPALPGFEEDRYPFPKGDGDQPKYAVRPLGIVVGTLWIAERRHSFGSAVAIARR